MVNNVYVNAPNVLGTGALSQNTLNELQKAALAHIEKLFADRKPVLTLWQDIASNFWPQMANFTYKKVLGDDFASNLSTSYPLLVSRELGNSISAMLRPPGVTWAHITVDRPDDQLDNASLQWLEAQTRVMSRVMNDPIAQFGKATKACDKFFVNFGQGVISVEVNPFQTALLYRSWHLRDVVWCERFDTSIGKIGRKWKPTAQELVQLFGENSVSPNVARLVTTNNGKEAYREVECMHIVVPSEEYPNNYGTPYVSIWIDCENKWLLKEEPSITSIYVIPRWETIPGSQYAYSPAVIAGLPDARLIQAITFTLLKAGEFAADPSMIAVENMVKSPIDITPGGVTWVDADYDEKTGEVLRPMTRDTKGIPIGFNMQDRLQQELRSAFYLDKMQLPPMVPDTTAFEIAQRIQEYIRQALPLFQPIEDEYNAPLCQHTFDLLMANNAFGNPADIPAMLQGRDVRFRFDSPLSSAEDQKLAQTFMTVRNLIAQVAETDPACIQMVDAQVALRDTLRGVQTPAKWIRDEQTMEQITAAQTRKQQQMEQMQMIQQAGAAGQQVGMAGQAVAGAQQQAQKVQ